jgi:hypothetical protein
MNGIQDLKKKAGICSENVTSYWLFHIREKLTKRRPGRRLEVLGARKLLLIIFIEAILPYASTKTY